MRQFYGIKNHFTRTDEYFGICTEDESDWLVKVFRGPATGSALAPEYITDILSLANADNCRSCYGEDVMPKVVNNTKKKFVPQGNPHHVLCKKLERESKTVYSIWNGIYNRCYEDKNCSFMCNLWLDDKDAEWWSVEYYECSGESMAVDKDLLFPENKKYAPDKCCIIPRTLNTMLSNCMKHITGKWRSAKMDLPLGVRYDSKMKMYYGEIKSYGYDEVIRLSYWETPEEAFEEYKRYKQADILIMAGKYKNKVPRKVYAALLRVDVKPY